jgi:uncharacterized membrane protein
LICAGVPVYLFTLLIAVFAILEPGSIETMVSLCIFTVVWLALLAAQTEVMTARRKWLLAGACEYLGLGFIALGALHSGYDVQHPRPDSIAYWLNSDTGKGSWIPPVSSLGSVQCALLLHEVHGVASRDRFSETTKKAPGAKPSFTFLIRPQTLRPLLPTR